MKKHLKKVILPLAFVCATTLPAYSQARAKSVSPHGKKAAVVAHDTHQTTEKAIGTVEKPTISFCVAEGNVRVSGWKRNEVRTLVDGGKVGYQIKQLNAEKTPIWLTISGVDPNNSRPVRRDECLNGSDIEIEVPYGSTIDIRGGERAGNFQIESVSKVRVRNFRGSVSLRDIREESEVSSLEGSIVAEDSTGRFSLRTNGSGNITASRLRPINVSDSLRFNSSGSGNVTLQNIEHANVEGSSTSGQVVVLGKPANGGTYDFKTTNGTVNLFLPTDASFQLNATMSEGGSFYSEHELKMAKPLTPNNSRVGSKRVIGTYGAGDATINLTTFNGSLRLNKQ